MSHPLDRQGFRPCHGSTQRLVAPIARVFHERPPVRAALVAVFASLLTLATAPPSPAQVLGASQLAVERRGHTATLLNDGRILVVGGENAAGPAAQSELIDPSSGAVTAGPVSGARTDHAAVLLGDGRVLITGGRDGAGALGTSEAFDPVANAFTAGPSLARARVGHSATRLTDGRVLVAGGDAEGSAEIFDSAAGTFTPLDYHLKVPRAFHGVVLLDDGKVLLAGGALPDGTLLRSAELFEPSTGSFARISRRMATHAVSCSYTVLWNSFHAALAHYYDHQASFCSSCFSTVPVKSTSWASRPSMP